MKKKPLMIIATTLIVLLLSPPIAYAGAVHFWWDNVYFVAGTDIDYPHPDNVYYDISPSSDWTRLGNNLYHNQINRDTTDAIRIGTAIFIDIVILILSAKLGGSSVAYYAAGLAGIVISTVISMAIDYYFVDERGCIWWWISWLFVYYLEANLQYLGTIEQDTALAEILAAFLCFGYFRVGMVTFNDSMGIGEPSPPWRILSISATSGGTTNPAPGNHSYDRGSSVTVTASPYSGYIFNYWLLDGYVYFQNPITVTMDSDHTLETHFMYLGGGCPTLFVWNGTDYTEEGVLNIHAESDITVQHPIQNTLALEKGVYKLQLKELNEYTSHIDQVRLYAVDSEGEWHSCPLTYAYHNELGKVTWRLFFDDEKRVDLTPTQTIDLKFLPSIPYGETVGFIFEINGYNPKSNPIDY